MISKIYETLLFLVIVDIVLYIFAIFAMMAEQEWVDKVLAGVFGLAAFIAVVFVITFIVTIWI